MRDNVVRMSLDNGVLKADHVLYQYDYGQRLLIEGIELPSVYEVHFSNNERGDSKIRIGDETGVDIPDEYLLSGEAVNVYFVLHTGEDDGETIYSGFIPVYARSKPTTEQPTPVQQNVIEQAIALLQETLETLQVATVEETEEIINEHEEVVNDGN